MNHRAGRQLPWTVVAVAAASMLMAIPAMAAVPNPTVTGPIPQNAAPGDPSHDYTFMASPLMGAFGYEEDRLRGTFLRAVASEAGRLLVGQVTPSTSANSESSGTMFSSSPDSPKRNSTRSRRVTAPAARGHGRPA